MIPIKAEFTGLGELRNELVRLSRAYQGQALRGAMRAAGKVLADEAKANTNSRRVKKSLTVVVQGNADVVRMRVGPKRRTPGARIAHFLEKGTRPHPIRARNSESLWRGRVVLGKFVQHPGARAKPFLLDVLPRQRKEVERKFASALRQITQKLNLKMLEKRG